jgi:hypothetical protein
MTAPCDLIQNACNEDMALLCVHIGLRCRPYHPNSAAAADGAAAWVLPVW